jgi:hypothetical protein
LFLQLGEESLVVRYNEHLHPESWWYLFLVHLRVEHFVLYATPQRDPAAEGPIGCVADAA